MTPHPGRPGHSDLPRCRDSTTPEFSAYVRLVPGAVHDDLARLGAS